LCFIKETLFYNAGSNPLIFENARRAIIQNSTILLDIGFNNTETNCRCGAGVSVTANIQLIASPISQFDPQELANKRRSKTQTVVVRNRTK
jgi:hypothetical protein